jgi:stage II sporulation protein P
MKKRIKSIDKMLLILILIASMLSVRNVTTYEKIQIAINIIIIAYFIIRMVQKNPIKIIQSKIDIAVVLLVLSTFIPLIFNTYISLHATVISCLNYITLFWLYILVRETSQKEEKNILLLINSIIFLTIILIALGIENLTTNKIFELFKVGEITNGENRLVSIFGNPNAFAGLIVFSYFLSLNQMINVSKESLKILYSTINTILLVGLVLTYSKLMFLIFLFMLVIYMVRIKEKSKNIYILQNTIVSVIIAFFYSYYFQKLVAQENYFGILLESMFCLGIAILFQIVNSKITQYIEKIKTRTILIIGGIAVVIIGLCIKVELQKTKEMVVFSEEVAKNYNSKIIKKVEPNQTYQFCFDMEAKIDLIEEEEDSFSINIIQRDEKNREITNQEETFGNFTGQKKIEVKTTENTREIKLEFKSKYQYSKKQWILHRLMINEEEIVLEYQHLPTKLVEKIQDIRLQYKTAQERFQFIEDGFKLISRHPLTGMGAEAWQYKYEEVQGYGYTTKDTHSYFVQIWLDFGLLGILSLLGIVFLVGKSKKQNVQGIQFALLALLLHSAMDSDMYFSSMKLLLFFGLGMIAAKNNENKVGSWLNAVIIVIPCISIFLWCHPQIYQKELLINEIENAKIGLYINSEEHRNLDADLAKACEEAIKYERDTSKTNAYEIKKIKAYVESGQNEKLEEFVQKYYERMLDYPNLCNYNTRKIIEKSIDINNLIQILEYQKEPKMYPWIVKLAKINLDEFETTKEQLENAIQNKYGKIEEEKDHQILMENYQQAITSYDRYFYGIPIQNTTKIDIKQYLNKDKKIETNNKEEIIIYHTHTTEAYVAEEGEYIDLEKSKTLNENYNVLKVGKVLRQSLEKQGFKVKHLQQYHDIEGINGAYTRSQNTIEEELKQRERKVDIVFDIHRDAYQENSRSENWVEIEGQKVANLRFVIAIGHEGWEENLNWAIAIQKKADERYPGLFKPLLIYDRTYNQSVTKLATLVEVGNEANTVEEAENSMKYLANLIQEVLK